MTFDEESAEQCPWATFSFSSSATSNANVFKNEEHSYILMESFKELEQNLECIEIEDIYIADKTIKVINLEGKGLEKQP